MHLEDRILELDEGEFLIVPRGVEHKPVASPWHGGPGLGADHPL